MKIVNNTIAIKEIKTMAENMFGDMLKAVVDVDRGIIAVDGELHSDLEALLLYRGSKQKDLWGINLYPEKTGSEFVEFDSLINIRPKHGNKIRGVDDRAVRSKISRIVTKKVKR